MPKKRKPSKDDLGPGTFIRLKPTTREWIAAKAQADGNRSYSSMIRKILEDAQAVDYLADIPSLASEVVA